MTARRRPRRGTEAFHTTEHQTAKSGRQGTTVVDVIDEFDRHREEVAIAPPTLFDAQAEADIAIEKVADTWRRDVVDIITNAVRVLAGRLEYVTADDVREQVGDAVDGADMRVVGAVLRQCQRDGLIESTGQYVPSRYRHGSPLVLWRAVRP